MSESLELLTKKWEKEQLALREQVITENTLDGQLKYIGGIDISYTKEDETQGCVALMVLAFPSLQIVYRKFKKVKLTQPYVPSYLAFREIEHLVEMFEELRTEEPDLLPQVMLIDGNGYLHPRGFGLACHFGVRIGIPTIGVSKNFFVMDGLGMVEIKKKTIEECPKKGDWMRIIGESGTILGASLITSDGSRRPLYVSIGHMIDLETAVEVVKACCMYRIPEPIRQADLASREFLRGGDVNRYF